MRLTVSIAVGLAAAILNPCLVVRGRGEAVDFFWSIYAARDLLAGHDPYASPSHADRIPYPLTAALFTLPLAQLPETLGASLFMGASSGLLAYGVLRRDAWWRMLLFLSAPYFLALRATQWTPLMMAILYFPAVSPLSMLKPQFALPLVKTRRQALACAIVVLGSLLVDPTWPVRWVSQLGPYRGFIPILTFPLLLLALVRWHGPGRGHFLRMASMPQHRYLYDSLLLWSLPRSSTEMLTLTCSSWIGCLAGMYLVGLRDHGDVITVLSVYLPVLAQRMWIHPGQTNSLGDLEAQSPD